MAKITLQLGSMLAQHSVSRKAPHQVRGVPGGGITGMGPPGGRVVFREPPVRAGKSGLKAILQSLGEMLISAKQF